MHLFPGTVLVGSYHDVSVHTSQSLPTDIVSYPNGSLFIPNARTSFSGAYICEAVNGIGSGLSKLVHLHVSGKSKEMRRSNHCLNMGYILTIIQIKPLSISNKRNYQSPTYTF